MAIVLANSCLFPLSHIQHTQGNIHIYSRVLFLANIWLFSCQILHCVHRIVTNCVKSSQLYL